MNLHIIDNKFMEAYLSAKDVSLCIRGTSKMWIKPKVKVKVSDLDREVLKRGSFPTPETGMIKIINKAFSTDLPQKTDLSKGMIDSENRKNLNVYSKPSFIDLRTIDLSVLTESINFLISILSSKHVKFHILSLQEAFDVVIKNSSACYPTQLKKNSIKAIENVKQSYSKFKVMGNQGKFEFIHSMPTYIFNRFTTRIKSGKGGRKSTTTKVRTVWGIPYFINVLEAMYFKWFSDHFKESMNGYFTGNDTKLEQSRKVALVRSNAYHGNYSVLNGDISNFDMSVSHQWFKIFFKILNKIKISKEIKIMFSYIVSYNTFTPFLNVDGNVDRTYGKITSGSYLTTFLNTFIMFIVCSYVFFKLHNRFPRVGELLVQGDDFIMLIPKTEDHLSILKYIKEIFVGFGLRLKILRQSITEWFEDIEYLGYFWNYFSEPDQTDDWVIAKLCYPERFAKVYGDDRVTIRAFSVLINLRKERMLSILHKLSHLDRNFKNFVSRMYGTRTFKLFNNLGNLVLVNIPFSRLMELGWKSL